MNYCQCILTQLINSDQISQMLQNMVCKSLRQYAEETLELKIEKCQEDDAFSILTVYATRHANALTATSSNVTGPVQCIRQHCRRPVLFNGEYYAYNVNSQCQ